MYRAVGFLNKKAFKYYLKALAERTGLFPPNRFMAINQVAMKGLQLGRLIGRIGHHTDKFARTQRRDPRRRNSRLQLFGMRDGGILVVDR